MNAAHGTPLAKDLATSAPSIATPSTSTPNSATPSIGPTVAVAPSANTSSRTGRLNRPRDRTRGHDDKKDGKK